jgi:hypothetical protein
MQDEINLMQTNFFQSPPPNCFRQTGSTSGQYEYIYRLFCATSDFWKMNKYRFELHKKKEMFIIHDQ